MGRIASLLLLVGLTGCTTAPLGYLDGDGPIASAIARLGWELIAISVGACVIIGVLLAWAIWRPRPSNDYQIVPTDDRNAIRYIIAGVALSTVFLLAAAVWTLSAVSATSKLPTGDALSINVIGHEWWWEVTYHSASLEREFRTANQLVIPVGVPVQVTLTSVDVIHSFWVPKLGGKMDMIPSRTNVTWLQASKVGDYRGQCSEFCGLQHANMAFTVHVLAREDFNKWWDNQLSPPTGSPDDLGAKTFMVRCAVCHTIRGTAAGGILGPDLSHFGSRTTIAAGLLANTPANLAIWINNTQTIKPGVKMPELDMLDSEVSSVTGYLESLK